MIDAIKNLFRYSAYTALCLFIVFIIEYTINSYVSKREKIKYNHDAYVYEQGYRNGWEAKENGDIFDPEYYE